MANEISEIKTTTGVIRLVRDGVVMAEQEYYYEQKGRRKDEIITSWKHRYGKKFYECEVHVINAPVKEKIFVKMEMRERTRRKIPGYLIASLPNFNVNEILKLQKIVNDEVKTRFG